MKDASAIALVLSLILVGCIVLLDGRIRKLEKHQGSQTNVVRFVTQLQ